MHSIGIRQLFTGIIIHCRSLLPPTLSIRKLATMDLKIMTSSVLAVAPDILTFPALTMQRPLSTDVCNPMLPVNMRTIPPPVSPGVPVHCPFAINECDCIGIFSPETNATGKEFVLSYWVKESAAASVLDYIQASVNISIGNTPVVPSSVRKSELIDRWQRVEVRFLILSGSTGNLNISLANASATTDAYFDDIRIHPFNSNMKSFVYHPVNLRLMAELDENNYATFYEYDQEGALIRVKKETERGIVTIQESKNSSRKP